MQNKPAPAGFFLNKYVIMSAYSFTATLENQQTPVLKKGVVTISTTVAIYWVVGENPLVDKNKCALLRAGSIQQLRIPVKCSKIGFLAVNEPGAVTIIEQLGGASASCA